MILSFMDCYRANALWALIAALAAIVGVSGAQEVSDDDDFDDDDAGRSKITFTAIALTDLPYEILYYRNGREAVEIEMREGRRSMPYPLARGLVNLELYTDHEDPEIKYRLLGKAPLVTGTRRMLYFFRENKSGEEGALPVDLFGIDDSEAAFPESSFRFFNFMEEPLAIQFDQDRFAMKARASTVRKLNLTESGSFTPFVIRNSTGRMLGGTRLFSHATNREMVLIFPPRKGKKRLDIRYFSD